ncbi:unnamed protein product [Boreogadus saida]
MQCPFPLLGACLHKMLRCPFEINYALDGTLSSIMTIEMADLEPCFKWVPPSDVIKASKKATGQYNRAHRS